MYSTKREIVEDAFAEIGLAPYVFDLTPGMLYRALRRLEALVAQWDAADHVRFGYPLSDDPDLDDSLSIPASAENALVLNLAVLIAPGHGKVLSAETKIAANTAYKALERAFPSTIPERNTSALPAGAGSKTIGKYDTFMPDTSSDINVADDSGPDLY